MSSGFGAQCKLKQCWSRGWIYGISLTSFYKRLIQGCSVVFFFLFFLSIVSDRSGIRLCCHCTSGTEGCRGRIYVCTFLHQVRFLKQKLRAGMRMLGLIITLDICCRMSFLTTGRTHSFSRDPTQSFINEAPDHEGERQINSNSTKNPILFSQCHKKQSWYLRYWRSFLACSPWWNWTLFSIKKLLSFSLKNSTHS